MVHRFIMKELDFNRLRLLADLALAVVLLHPPAGDGAQHKMLTISCFHRRKARSFQSRPMYLSPPPPLTHLMRSGLHSCKCNLE